jgi:hypothetical protein
MQQQEEMKKERRRYVDEKKKNEKDQKQLKIYQEIEKLVTNSTGTCNCKECHQYQETILFIKKDFFAHMGIQDYEIRNKKVVMSRITKMVFEVFNLGKIISAPDIWEVLK